MNSFREIIGNDNAKSSLIKTIQNNNILHAYIISSSDLITRRDVAMSFAKGIMCQNFKDDCCLECVSCKTIDTSNNPDVKIIEREVEDGKQKGNILIEQVREIVADSNVKPYCNKNKVYIIDDADTMNVAAQNALLKTLEEPNEFTKLILLVSNVKKMLPTILSRCIIVKLNPLNKEELKKWCSKNGIIKDDLDYYINYSMGNVTALKNVIENEDFITKREEVLDITQKLVSNDADDILYVKDYLNNEKESISVILDILEIWFRDLILILNNINSNIINMDKIDKLKFEASKTSFEKAEAVINNIIEFKKAMNVNANYKLLVEVFQINIREV